MSIRMNEPAVTNPSSVTPQSSSASSPQDDSAADAQPSNVAKPSLRVLSPAEIAHNEAAKGTDVDSQGIPNVRGALAADPPLHPTEEFLAELKRESDALESATPQEILKWAADRFAPKFTMATAFGPEGMTILHMLSTIAPETPVFNLETGYQFKETLELRERVKERYGIEVQYKYPDTTVEEFEAEHGGPLYKTDPNRCCFERKLRVLHRAASGWHAWASAIRRDQSEDRAKAPIVGWDKKFQLVKISPLANWTKKDVWSLIFKENIPYNPLHDQGYPSIGCQACTRPVQLGEDERAGRWSGFQKTECGLHTSD